MRYRTRFILTNLIQMLVHVYSLMIYTSLFEFLPWYTGEGEQFLGILVISDPIYFLIGVNLMFFNLNVKLHWINLALPFMAILAFTAPILVDGGLGLAALLTGIVLGVSLFMINLCVFIKTLKIIKEPGLDLESRRRIF